VLLLTDRIQDSSLVFEANLERSTAVICRTDTQSSALAPAFAGTLKFRNTGHAVDRERRLKMSKLFWKLFAEVLTSLLGKQATNIKFLVRIFMTWLIDI
jgi:hypothetical protein